MRLSRRAFVSGSIVLAAAGPRVAFSQALQNADRTYVLAFNGISTLLKITLGTTLSASNPAQGLAATGLRTISFTPTGGFVAITTNNTARGEGVPSDCTRQLRAYEQSDYQIQDVAFTQNGWVIITDKGFFAKGMPTKLFETLQKLIRIDGIAVQKCVVHPTNPNQWVILHEEGFEFNAIPSALLQKMRSMVANSSRNITNVLFSPNNSGWAVCANDIFFMHRMPDAFFDALKPWRASNIAVDVAAVNPADFSNSWVAVANPPTMQTRFERDGIWDRLDAAGVPGASIAVASNNQLDWSASYGYKRLGSPARVTPNTLFQAASISKPITALGLMRMVEANQVALADGMGQHLQNWSTSFATGVAGNIEPNLLQLVTHSAGFRGNYGGYAPGSPMPTTIQILNGSGPTNHAPRPITYVPGTNATYSGTSFTVLQKVMSDVARMTTFADFMRDEVLDPLGMHDSFFGPYIPTHLEGRVASSHIAAQGTTTVVDGERNYYPELAAAGLYTTPKELLQSILMINSDGMIDGRPFLNQANANSIITRQHNFPVLGATMGIGFRMSNVDPNTGRANVMGSSYFHGGTNNGSTSFLRGDFADGAGIAVVANANGRITSSLANTITSLYGW